MAGSPGRSPRKPDNRRGLAVNADQGGKSRAFVGPARLSALDPELRLSGAVVGSLDVPVLAERIVVHRRDEVERRLELDVVEAGVRGEELMPFPGRDQHQVAGTDGEAATIVLHLAGAFLDEVEVLRYHRTGLGGMVHVPRRMGVRRVRHATELQVP